VPDTDRILVPVRGVRTLSAELPAGTVLSDRYEIIRTIGQGGMGSVYLASDRRLSVKQWAVKEMILTNTEFQDKAEVEKLFTDEAHILASLDHPNLPRVMDFFSEGDRKYLIMEYIEGETLEKVVLKEEAFLPVKRVLTYSLQIADVLKYLHNQKPSPIIFRDLKPQNIMITRDDRVKLIDFGIARIFVAGKSKDTIVLGTPGYASPEHYGRAQTDQRSDIFSFGATLYFLLTREDPGKSPFHFPPPRTINGDIPTDLDALILKAVSISPGSRYRSIGEMMDELKLIFEDKPLPAPCIQPATSLPLPAVTNLLPLQAATGMLSFDQKSLDFGVLKRGYVRQMSFKICGNVKGTVSSDKKWIKLRPLSVKGTDPVVDAIIDTQGLKHGGAFMGNIIFSGKNMKMTLPVSVTIHTQPLTFWNYVIAFALTIVSFVPGLGFLGFFLMLSLYYSCPYEERGLLSAFMVVSSIISIVWFVLLVVILGKVFLLPRLAPH
jgi:serine/threonine protein kinase